VLLELKINLEDSSIAVHHVESSRGGENSTYLRCLSDLSCFVGSATDVEDSGSKPSGSGCTSRCTYLVVRKMHHKHGFL
jgi:hypothetical protein